MSRKRTAKNPIQAGDGDPRHGTVAGYQYHNCRCEDCRQANHLPCSGVASIVRPYIVQKGSKRAKLRPLAKPAMVNYLTQQKGRP